MATRTKKRFAFWLGLLVGAAAAVVRFWPAETRRTFTEGARDRLEEMNVSVMSAERVRKVKRRWATLVKENARRYNVDPDLVLAVILTESAGRPGAKSPRGARGLMQLMPATARDMAAKLKLGKISSKDLYRPELNIRLGTYYLSTLMRPAHPIDYGRLGRVPGGGFGYNLELVLAAYNGGMGNVRKWIRRGGPVEPAEVIEREGFTETRRYVVRVKKYLEILRTSG